MLKRCFEDEIVEYALSRENHERFARLLNRILPVYVRWAWGQDSPYRRHFNEWQRSGFNLMPNHYYSPVPDVEAIASTLGRRSEMPGVELRRNEQIATLREMCPPYSAEYARFAERPSRVPHEFHFNNGVFERVDAELLHCMVRHHKPAHILEVGAGYSTLISAAACVLNRELDDAPCELIAIEPYPNDLFLNVIPGLTELVRRPLQKVDTELFTTLGENDILFIDSSHVLKVGSDVAHLYLEVLPRLRPGVIVHLHDIFLPAEYPESWIRDEHIFWNEQHLLQAFLAFSSTFEVLIAASLLHLERPDVLAALFPGYSPERHTPGSFWIRRCA